MAVVFQIISIICILGVYIGMNYEIKQLKDKIERLEDKIKED